MEPSEISTALKSYSFVAWRKPNFSFLEKLYHCIFIQLLIALKFITNVVYAFDACVFALNVFFSVFLTIIILVWFFQPGAFLGGVGGLVFLIHYNDERRAIPKGDSYFLFLYSVCSYRMLFLPFS